MVKTQGKSVKKKVLPAGKAPQGEHVELGEREIGGGSVEKEGEGRREKSSGCGGDFTLFLSTPFRFGDGDVIGRDLISEYLSYRMQGESTVSTPTSSQPDSLHCASSIGNGTCIRALSRVGIGTGFKLSIAPSSEYGVD